MIVLLPYLLLVAGAVVSLGNWIGMIHWYTRKQRTSLIPVIGGALGLLGCAVHPGIHWTWGFLALALDPWCVSLIGVPKLIETIWRAIHKRKSSAGPSSDRDASP